ncbi:MAG: PEP/pyruvate-binding domain-containing protein, partial [Candidatus Omnitrophota bacterium]
MKLIKMVSEFKAALEKDGLSSLFAFVDLHSFHATVFDLINEPETRDAIANSELNPGRLKYINIRREVEAAARRFLVDRANGFEDLRAQVKITGIGMFEPGVVKLDLKFIDETGRVISKVELDNFEPYQKFKAFRDKLHQYLTEEVKGYKEIVRGQEPAKDENGKVVRPKLGSLAGHITIGYTMRVLSVEEICRFVETLKAINDKFKAGGEYSGITFELTQGAVTQFVDMNHYLDPSDSKTKAKVISEIIERLARYNRFIPGEIDSLRMAIETIEDYDLKDKITNLFLKRLKFVMDFSDFEAKDVTLAGGKGASLAELAQITGINVPEGFNVTTLAYDLLIKNSDLISQITELERLSNNWQSLGQAEREIIFAKAREIREAIINSTIPFQVVLSVLNAYRQLCKKCDIENIPVAVRSSATAEDLPNASFAGQQDTFLNCIGEEKVLEAIKLCWASLFSDRAVEYRNQNNFQHSKVKLCAVVQRMINSVAAGVAFSVDRTSGYEGLHINANHGLGESVVSGKVNSDEWLVCPETLEIIYRRLGSKALTIEFLEQGGTVERDTSVKLRDAYCLSTERIKEIASSLKAIAKHYQERHGYKYIDTEFAVNKKGRLYFVQARPETVFSFGLKCMAVDVEVAKVTKKVLEGGITGSMGAACGVVKVVRQFEDLASGKVKIGPEDIVVAPNTDNRWTQYLTQFRAIVTDVGNTSCHAAIISTERGVPCIVATQRGSAVLAAYEGMRLTVDATNCIIYEGSVTLKAASGEDLRNQFEVMKEIRKRTFEEKVQEVVTNKAAEQDSKGRWWLGRPYYSFRGFQLDLLWRAFEYLEKEILKAPIVKKIERGIIFTLMGQVQADTTPLENMNLGELERIYEDGAKVEREYLELCSRLVLSEVDLRKWEELYIRLNAYMDLAFAYRSELDRRASVLAEKKRIPKYFYDQFRLHVQSQAKQEDEEYRWAIIDLARDIIFFAEGQGMKIENIEVATVKKYNPQLYQKMCQVASRYKVGKGSDMTEGIPLTKLLSRLKAEIINSKTKNILELASENREIVVGDIEYYPEDIDFQRLLCLAIRSKIQMNNFHHTKIRGQWSMREKLLGLAGMLVRIGGIAKPEDIFEKTIAEIINLHKLYKQNAYPLPVPTQAQKELEKQFGKNFRSSAIEAEGFKLKGILPLELTTVQAEAMHKRLSELEQLLGRAPPVLSDWRLIFTTDLSLTQGNVAACDIDTKTVFIHPYFFSLNDSLQLKILYHELISHIANNEYIEAKALKDTIVFFGCKDLSKEVGLPVYVDMKTLDVIYGLEARIWVQHWFKTFGANSMSKAPLWMSLMLANTHTDEQGEVLKGKEPNLTQYGVPEAVLYSGQQGPYWNDYKLWDDIKAHNLRPDVTVLPAGTIPAFLNGVRYEEFIRTEGHHHKTNLPEVYENNYGNNIFLLFKVKHPRPEEDSSIHEPGYEEVEDVMAVFAEPGDHVLFPPGYQHITINIGNTPFVMTDWVSLNAQSSFKYIKRHNGAPYWVVKGKDGKPEFIPNPRYKNIPPIRLVRPAAEIPEFGFKKGEPMFDIVKNGQIDKLAFLNDPSQSQEYNRIYRNAFIPCQSQAGFINNKVALWRSHSTKVNDLRTEQVNIEEKLSVALSGYDIGASETSQVRYEFLQGGIENRRPVLIHAPKGDFVLKFIADSRRKAEFVISVIERAISFGIPVPFVYTNRDGKYFTKIGSWYYALEDYISSGVELNFSQASPQHFFSLGRLTALLHNAFLGFRPHGSKPELSPQDIITALSDFDNLENKLQNSPFPQAGELIFLSFTRFIKEQMQHLLREMSDVSYNSLPSSILHGDLSLGNVKWEGSSIIALYDWEKARSSQPR